MKNQLSWITIIAVIVFLLVFLKFGRSIYMPLLNKFKNKETVQSIQDKLESKVWNALSKKSPVLGLKEWPEKIALLAFKEEEILEVYIEQDSIWKKLISYPFTTNSGQLGPKLKEGDRQIPEGIYEIEYLNPNSAYYLSMKVNYPNAFDKKMANADNRQGLGNDIFIHGKDRSIGCIAIGDAAIEELFILVSHASANGRKVIIAPRDFRVNKTRPAIDKISWENDLYDKLEKELRSF